MCKLYLKIIALSLGVVFLASGKVLAQPVISDVVATSTRNAAALTWIANNEEGVAAVNFNYGESENYGLTSTVKTTLTTGGIKYYFSTALKNLTAGKKYYYKILLFDSVGESSYYTGSLETSPADLVAPKISAVGAAVQNENATISWITDEESNSIVYYSPEGGQGKTKTLEAVTNEHFVYLGELLSNTNYRYRVSSADVSGNVSTFEELNFRTGKSIMPPSDVSNLRLVVLGTSTFRLTWKNIYNNNFDHVKMVRTAGVPAASPDDGIVVYEGKGEIFVDKPDHIPAHHYYTVYSYNTSGDYSGGASIDCPFVKHGIELKVATISDSQKMSASDFQFFSAHRENPIQLVNNVVSHNPGANFSITVPTKVLPLIPQIMFIKIDGGEIHQFYPEGSVFVTDFKFPSAGIHDVYIEIDYANSLIDIISFQLNGRGASAPDVERPKQPVVVEVPSSTPVVKKVPSTLPSLTETASIIKNFAENEDVQQTVSEVVAPTIVGVATVSAITAISWVNVLPFLQFIIVQPLAYFGRRRKTAWGQVYNSLNKAPVDLAVVRLVNKDTNRVVQSKVTDGQGRYAFIVSPGNYVLQVLKGGFIFPSVMLQKAQVDGSRTNIYHGGIINISESEGLVAVDIPLDPAGGRQKSVQLVWHASLRHLQVSISWIGLAVIIFSLIISPRWYTWVLLGVQILSILVLRRLSRINTNLKNWGTVIDEKTKKPIAHAVTRLFNAEFNKLVATQITDVNGRFYFLAGDGEYYISCERAGYISKKSSVLNLKGRKAANIALDISLIPTISGS